MASDPIRNAMAANRDIPKKQPSPFQDCSDVVHIALFFDGTGNNKDKDGATQSWSNVARIFHAAQSHVQLNTYPIYIAGVGTPFNGGAVKWNSMPGVWIEDKVLGMGSGGGGERRLSLGDDSLNDRLRAVLIANAR
ncbi:MAG: T6SS phospholipase effector Tle1-like catalytic domain-containing protein, partial [Halobacteriota archaeon]